MEKLPKDDDINYSDECLSDKEAEREALEIQNKLERMKSGKIVNLSEQVTLLTKNSEKLASQLKKKSQHNTTLQIEVGALMRRVELLEKENSVPKSIKSISDLKKYYADEVKEKDRQLAEAKK